MIKHNKIYTHDEAMLILEMVDDVLSKYCIFVPGDDADDPDKPGLHGMTYSDLLDEIESSLVELLEQHTPETEVVKYVFSGNV